MNKILWIDRDKTLSDKISSYLMPELIMELSDDMDAHIGCLTSKAYKLIAINPNVCVDWITYTVDIRRKSDIPILIITKERNLIDEITALRIGADDYIVTGQEAAVLAMRIKSWVRRYSFRYTDNANEPNIIQIKDLTINYNSREVYKQNDKIPLTKTEYDMLVCFIKNKGITLTKDQIYEKVWNNEYVVGDRNIITHIRRLRTKIEDDPESPRYIHTVRGLGYKFIYQEP